MSNKYIFVQKKSLINLKKANKSEVGLCDIAHGGAIEPLTGTGVVFAERDKFGQDTSVETIAIEKSAIENNSRR